MLSSRPGFVPRAQFIFAKNCSQIWAEALNDFTPWHEGQQSQELPNEAQGEKDAEKDQEPKPELEVEAKETEQVRPRRLMGSERWWECRALSFLFRPGGGHESRGTGDMALTASCTSLGACV